MNPSPTLGLRNGQTSCTASGCTGESVIRYSTSAPADLDGIDAGGVDRTVINGLTIEGFYGSGIEQDDLVHHLSSSIRLAGTNLLQFVASETTCGNTVEPRDRCVVRVAYRPTTTGQHTARLEVRTGLPAPALLAAGLSGKGVASVATPSATRHAFGDQRVGQSTAAETITITNTGDASLSFASFTRAGANPQQFALGENTCVGASVAPNETCTFTVAFKPTSAGDKVAQIQI